MPQVRQVMTANVVTVTDRDLIARGVAASRGPNTVRCEEIATKDLVTVRPTRIRGRPAGCWPSINWTGCW
jgi:hypothetical protein